MRTRLACCTALVLACLAAPAAAQGPADEGPKVPPDAPVVASEPGEYEFVVFDRNGRLCRAFVRPDYEAPTGICDRYTKLTAHTSELWRENSVRRFWLAGVVSGDVAAVEVELRDGQRVRADTTDGAAYTGTYAGHVRFAVVEIPAGAAGEIRLVRYLAADGRVIGAQGALDGPRFADKHRVARVERRGLRWELRADAYEELVPDPLELDRLEQRRCVFLRSASEPEASRTCFTPGAPDLALRAAFQAGCDAAGTRVVVLAAPGVTRVRAVLGDGTRRSVRLRSLPTGWDGHRAGVLFVPRHMALRALVAPGVPALRLGLAPASAQCDAEGSTNDDPFVSPVFSDPRRHGSAVTVRDEGSRLCLALGPLRPFWDCLPAPIQASESRFVIRREDGKTTLLGVVTADVAAVRLQSAAGPVEVAPSDVGYAGRYRDHLRFVHATLPGTVRLWGARLLAADGSRIAAAFGPELRHVHAPHTVARAGGFELTVGMIALGGQEIPCAFVSTGAATLDERSSCPPQFSLLAETPCTPRRIVIASILPRRARRVEIRLASGRVVRVPAVRAPGGGRAFLAVLPRGAAPRALRVRGVGHVTAYRLPPAREQCGYQGPLEL